MVFKKIMPPIENCAWSSELMFQAFRVKPVAQSMRMEG